MTSASCRPSPPIAAADSRQVAITQSVPKDDNRRSDKPFPLSLTDGAYRLAASVGPKWWRDQGHVHAGQSPVFLLLGRLSPYLVVCMVSDEELMLATGKGDLHAFEDIVLRHQKTAWNVAYRFLGNSHDAEDIVQDAFMKILEAAPRYKPTASFRTYLFRVITHLCINAKRKRRPVYRPAPPETPDSKRSPSADLAAAERAAALRLALDALPANQRMALILRYYEGLGYHEIADAMSTSEKAVERLLARGRATLQARFQGLRNDLGEF